jgi:D-alanyl-D-alanine carboxypeptidase
MNRRGISLLLCLALIFTIAAPAAAEEEQDISMEVLEVEDADWIFPVALEDLNPEYLVLANKHYLLDKDYVCKPLVKMAALKLNKDGTRKSGHILMAVSSKMQLNEVCAEALTALSEGARADGYKLYLKSAYRSWQTQNTMYKNRLKKNKGKDDGWVSMAGASDHQTGLGCDVIPRSWIKASGMNSKMASEPECIWMEEHCAEYGFIIRYPKYKEEVTEIHYEPWHLRYVGIPAAAYIMGNGLCLEEFTEQLQAAIQDYLAAGGDPAKVEALIQTPNGD